jgi:hypothetical protein
MNLLLLPCLCVAAGLAIETGTGNEAERPTVLIVVGAAGTPEYASQFRGWADQWQAAARKAAAETIVIGLDGGGANDRDRLRAALAEKVSPTAAASAPAPSGREPLWLVLIGHGTFDGRESKFNMRGPDISDAELAEWLGPIKRPIVVLACASASGPFLNRLSGADRVVITATKSGNELNFSRFGQYLAEAIADPRADLDKDGQVSLLEAYLTAGSRVGEYYRTRAQLATEHALLDDNGDKLGTPADWFRGIRATRRAKDGAALDGVRSHQLHLVPSDRERGIPAASRRRRDQIELALAALRDGKDKLPGDEYYRRLEGLMVELARIYRDLPAAGPGPADRSAAPGAR